MPCRDYDLDYQVWLGRSREHLDKMTDLLRQLCQEAKRHALEIPPAVARWEAESTSGDVVPLNKQVFDDTAQMLCLLCREAEKKSVPLPPAVAAWWAEHKARDEQLEDLTKGLAPTPVYASFWEEHAAKESLMSELPGINHMDAIRALIKAGYRVLRQGKTIVMTDGTRQLLIPADDPVNGFAMANIIRIAGLKEAEFRALL
jgi:hypothetical protein